MTRYRGRGSLFAIVLITLPALLSPTLASAFTMRDLGCAFFDHRPQRVRHCSNAGAPPDFFLANITTRHVSCRTAMRFIISLHGSRPFFKTEVTHLRAYTCTPSSEGVAATWVRCVDGRRLIRWLNGT